MKKPMQLSFLPKPSVEFGGSLLVGKRKTKRPISTKNPMHLVLKSEKARGVFSFVNQKTSIEQCVRTLTQKIGVKIYDLAVNYDHIHGVMKFETAAQYKAWIRAVTSKIVEIISARTKKVLKGFFTLRPYTRILSWGKQLRPAFEYLELNKMEVFGLRPAKKKAKSKNALQRKQKSPCGKVMGRHPSFTTCVEYAELVENAVTCLRERFFLNLSFASLFSDLSEVR